METLRFHEFSHALRTLSFYKFPSYTGDFKFYKFARVQGTLNFYDSPLVLQTLFFFFRISPCIDNSEFLQTFPLYWVLLSFPCTGDFWVSPCTVDFELLRTFIFAIALDTLNLDELSSCTGYFEFLRIPHVLETLSFYDFRPCIGIRFLTNFLLYWGLWVFTAFPLYQILWVLTSFPHLLETLSFVICPMPCKNKVLFCIGYLTENVKNLSKAKVLYRVSSCWKCWKSIKIENFL